MSRRTTQADLRASSGRDGLAPLASVTLARLYLEQRQPDRARAMLRAVLARNPLDVVARALARRVGPPSPRLSLIADGQAWIVRGEVPMQLAAFERLEVALAIFRADTVSFDTVVSETSQVIDRCEPEWIVRDVVFNDVARSAELAGELLAREDMVPFEVQVDSVRGLGRASIAACLRRRVPTAGVDAAFASTAASRRPSPGLSTPHSNATARIIAVAAVQHV